MINLHDTLGEIDRLLPDFNNRVSDIGQRERGVDVSEIFFIFASCAKLKPRQIVESGRALGMSTALLGRVFPDTPVMSIEFEVDHPDSALALENLKEFPNVACLFGDSRVIMPEVMLPGDIAVIDGPKGFRALKLVYRLFEEKQPSAVFLHDCCKGSDIRGFLEKYIPWAFFSDDPEFVRKTCHLDSYHPPEILKKWSDLELPPQSISYAGTYACIPLKEGFPTIGDWYKLRIHRLLENLRRPFVKKDESAVFRVPKSAD